MIQEHCTALVLLGHVEKVATDGRIGGCESGGVWMREWQSVDVEQWPTHSVAVYSGVDQHKHCNLFSIGCPCYTLGNFGTQLDTSPRAQRPNAHRLVASES